MDHLATDRPDLESLTTSNTSLVPGETRHGPGARAIDLGYKATVKARHFCRLSYSIVLDSITF
jgi:hypothetical protein